MPATIREIITEHGELLKVGEWTLTPNTRRGEYARITGVHSHANPRARRCRNPGHRPEVRPPHLATTHAWKSQGCRKTKTPSPSGTPNTRPELGNCDARGNLAYFDLDPDAPGAPAVG